MTMTHIRGEPRAYHILSLLREQYGGQYGSSGYQGSSNHPVAKGIGIGVGSVAAAGLGAGALAIHKAGGSVTNPEHIGAMYNIAKGAATLAPAYITKVFNDRGAVEGAKHIFGLIKTATGAGGS